MVPDKTPGLPSRPTTDIGIAGPGDDDLHICPEIDCAAATGMTDGTTAHLRTHIPETDRDDPTTDDIDRPDEIDHPDRADAWPIERDDGFNATSRGTFLWRGWCVTMALAGHDADQTPLYRVAEQRFLPTRGPRPGYLGA